MSSSEDARRLLDKTIQLLRTAGVQAKEGLRRTYEVTTLRMEIAGHERSLEDVLRELGRLALAAHRAGTEIPADPAATLVRRVDELEARIAEKQRLVEEAERERADGGSSGGDETAGSSTQVP